MTIQDKSFGSRLFDLILMICMLAIVFVTLYPFYHILIISLSEGSAVLRGAVSFWPVDATLDSYRLVFDDPNVPRSLTNSVIYTVVGTIINLFMTALCAYPLARPRFPPRPGAEFRSGGP